MGYIKSQIAYGARKLSEIPSEQWITVLQGNHEDHHLNYGYLAADVAEKVGAVFGTTDCKIIYKNTPPFISVGYTNPEMVHVDTLFKQFAIHGRKQITSTADNPARAAANMELIIV